MFALLFVTPSGGKHKGTQCTAYTPEQPAFSGSFRYLPCVSSPLPFSDEAPQPVSKIKQQYDSSAFKYVFERISY